VARDLARTLGVDVSVAPAVAPRPFTGSVRVAGGPAGALTRLAATLNMEVSRRGYGWRIGPPAPRT
jgi:transmembrane sensor